MAVDKNSVSQIMDLICIMDYPVHFTVLDVI